jgi:hypothetical protein
MSAFFLFFFVTRHKRRYMESFLSTDKHEKAKSKQGKLGKKL